MGKIKLPLAFKVPARSVRIAVLRQASATPQILATDRHIAQSGFEFKSAKWNSSENSLDGSVSLVGNFPLTMYISVPEGFSFDKAESSAESSAAIVPLKTQSPILGFSLKSNTHFNVLAHCTLPQNQFFFHWQIFRSFLDFWQPQRGIF